MLARPGILLLEGLLEELVLNFYLVRDIPSYISRGT